MRLLYTAVIIFQSSLLTHLHLTIQVGNRLTEFYSLRRFVKTTISDIGYANYSKYFIGYAGSTYWRKKDSEKAEIFRKIEPHLTFLNVHQLVNE
ncbi:MAG: hypothetical protein WBE61_12580 [Nitrososphaeraceae archaeon]